MTLFLNEVETFSSISAPIDINRYVMDLKIRALIRGIDSFILNSWINNSVYNIYAQIDQNNKERKDH